MNGKKYRYKVHYKKNGRGWYSTGTADVSMADVPSMYYEFGAHKMEIGKALIEIFDFLDDQIDRNHSVLYAFDYFDDGKEED